jgi:hypothetical protein
MKTSIRIPLVAALLLAASPAWSHGPSTGALLPHAHPHSAAGSSGLELLLMGLIAGAVVALVVRASAKRR